MSAAELPELLAPPLTVAEVAAWLRKSPSFVRRECREGTLRAAFYGGAWHVRADDVAAYLAARSNSEHSTHNSTHP